ncbi:G-type lectin S-receptor-like serine/threonine-protein kinase SD2-5 [Populus alba]|uniref:G-type lectin S-receptor-like serine/threonine-protein kinase SD2-5 n=1 Tax=Populus alba TaxID=43335 RepID=UPI003CC70180
MKMMETGNLVLYNRNNKTIWQSFDHATDALLLGQILQVGQKLVASVSRGNRSEGSYYLSVASEGLFAFYQANVPQMYYYNRPFGGTVIMGIQLNYSASDNGALCQLIFSDLAGYGDVWLGRSNRCSQTSYMKYDHDGHLRLYYDNLDQPVDLLEDEMDDCDYPTSCGTYGLCSGGRCSCPSGFARDNDSMAQGKNGCLEINPVECENPHQSQSLLTLEDVYYFNYVDDGAAALKETDMKSCQQACLNNCSCKAALFLLKGVFLQGSCFLHSPVLSLSRDGISLTLQGYKSYAFIKVSNHGMIGKVSRPVVLK